MPTSDLQAELDRIGPAPTSDPVDRLRHVVRCYQDVDRADEVITATRNVYGQPYWTGLNHGDLRELLERVQRLEWYAGIYGPGLDS